MVLVCTQSCSLSEHSWIDYLVRAMYMMRWMDDLFVRYGVLCLDDMLVIRTHNTTSSRP